MIDSIKVGAFFLTWFGFFAGVGHVCESYGHTEWYIAVGLLVSGFFIGLSVFNLLNRWF